MNKTTEQFLSKKRNEGKNAEAKGRQSREYECLPVNDFDIQEAISHDRKGNRGNVNRNQGISDRRDWDSIPKKMIRHASDETDQRA